MFGPQVSLCTLPLLFLSGLVGILILAMALTDKLLAVRCFPLLGDTGCATVNKLLEGILLVFDGVGDCPGVGC